MPDQSYLFLSESYTDTYDDYRRSLTQENFPVWDYVFLTASNEKQAEGFRRQLAFRDRKHLLPSRTHFAVLPDPEGKRVGSGGATLGVLRHIASHRGSSDFSGLRILVIHSGGDSKRVPQYSALGKLFSPVPHERPDGYASTLFDELLTIVSSIPSRIQSGMLLLSGDVLLLFNPLLIDYSGRDAAAISFKERAETGKNHGVFLCGEDGYVAQFLHKQPVTVLRQRGAVNDREKVDIDTGAVIFSSDMLSALYSLISTDHLFDPQKYDALVNERVRLSLYGDFLYPLASASSLPQFLQEKPEGDYCPELNAARTLLWKALRPFRLKLLRLAPAKFIHFGTTREILNLMNQSIEEYEAIGWQRHINSSVNGKTAGYNSVLSEGAVIGEGCYLETSYVHSDAQIGDHTFLSYVDVQGVTVPSHIVLHGLKQEDGTFVVRIFGIQDNPKSDSFLGTGLSDFLAVSGITEEELWTSDDHTLWTAALYPVCNTIQEALEGALNLYWLAQGKGDRNAFRNAERKSLYSSFEDADPEALMAWDKRMQELVRMNRLLKLITDGSPAEEAKTILNADHLTPIQEEWLEKHLKQSNFSRALRLYYYVGTALGGTEGDRLTAGCFRHISDNILQATLSQIHYQETARITADRYTVTLPLRVNWGGGWSDTPPYCNEKGGTVLNAAILLHGREPVRVDVERIPEYRVVFDSRDMDVHGEFDSIEELQKVGNPHDPFVLQKAALLACGILPRKDGDLRAILQRIGGGFILKSAVSGVPKGSGLGTSSILAAACVKALLGFMNLPHSEDTVCHYVLAMEQLMSTGGGWQDQAGGLTKGIKYIRSIPGLLQKITIEPVHISDAAKAELDQRFALIYTGQRRLARNLLRNVVGRYIGNDPIIIRALNEIQRMAALMRFELERGNIDALAELFNEHWKLSQQIDAASTNTLINQILTSIKDYIDGQMICGAGGGGFLQVILKKGVRREDVHEKLKEVFQDSEIDLWDCMLI